jgi:hypothetical protein
MQDEPQLDANDNDSDFPLVWSDEQLAKWFFQETGVHLSFSMQEVANVANNLSPGGLDRGGYWDMAKTIARQRVNKNEEIRLVSSSSSIETTKNDDNNSQVGSLGRRKRPR